MANKAPTLTDEQKKKLADPVYAIALKIARGVQKTAKKPKTKR